MLQHRGGTGVGRCPGGADRALGTGFARCDCPRITQYPLQHGRDRIVALAERELADMRPATIGAPRSSA
jgi:hypothetical protein